MRHYDGCETVDSGVYVDFHEFKFRMMEDKGPLPGTAETHYYRVPMLALFVAGPIIGLVYVMFLPLIGFVAIAGLLAEKSMKMVRRWARPRHKAGDTQHGSKQAKPTDSKAA